MSLEETGFILAGGLFVGMLLLLELGWRRGRAVAEAGGTPDSAAIDGAVFGLLGLLIAFTFSGAAARFDARRHLIVEEANAIGTAYLRVDLLPADVQPGVRERFARYLDARIAMHRQVGQDRPAAEAAWQTSLALQGEIWPLATAGVRRPEASPGAPLLVLPALNAMFDIATTRKASLFIHPPRITFYMLVGLALLGALVAGSSLTGPRRPWLHMLVLALTTAITVYVIRDLEYPRAGLIRVDAADLPLVELRRSMPAPPR